MHLLASSHLYWIILCFVLPLPSSSSSTSLWLLFIPAEVATIITMNHFTCSCCWSVLSFSRMSMKETTTATSVVRRTGKGKTASDIIQQSNEMKRKQQKCKGTTMETRMITWRKMDEGIKLIYIHPKWIFLIT